MKKYFPIFVLTFVFVALLVGQVGLDFFGISATLSNKNKSEALHYESLFKEKVFKDIEGREIKLSEVQEPIVVLNFWASWCRPCLEEMPSLNELAQNKDLEDKILVIGINSDEEKQIDSAKKILSEYKIKFPTITSGSSKILSDFMVSSIPFSIIFHKGKVIEVSKGQKDFSSIEMINKLKSLSNL